MPLDSNDFAIFELEPRFAIDAETLEQRRRALQAEVHPDRFAAQGAAAQRLAMQWAVRVNEAYRRLKDPLQRAVVLCELHGAAVDAERNTAMPTDFLVRQMAWREALDDARDLAAVEALAAEVAEHRRGAIERLAETFDVRHDAVEAASQVRALMFVERFADDVDRRLEALGQ